MNTHRPDDPGHDATMLPDALRWQLRALRRDEPPQGDLWPGIAARLHQPADARRAAPMRGPRHRRRTAWYAAAAAAVLAVAVGWQLRPLPVDAPSTGDAPQAVATIADDPPLLLRQADAMTREYEAARREIEATRPTVRDAAALSQLDHSAAEVRAALALDPEARFLLDRLQHVYARRLALMLQAA